MTNLTTGLYFAEYQHTLTPVAPPSVTRKRLNVKQCTSVFFKVLIVFKKIKMDSDIHINS